MGEVTRAWPEDRHARGEELRRLVSAAADHIATGADVREAKPLRRQLAKAIQKLGLVKQIWRLVRGDPHVDDQLWDQIEDWRDRAERLTRGLHLAVGRQIKAEASTLKGMCS